jgi:hypothetical protein
MESNKSFIIKLLYLTLLMEILSLGWKFFMPIQWVSPTILVMPLFFLGLTLIIHGYLSKTIEQRFQNFLNRYLIVTTVKLLGLLAILGVYIFTFKDDAINFVIVLFVNYMVFTLFEARALIISSKN